MSERTLIGWCPDCEAYVEPYVKSDRCPGWEGERGPGGDHPSQFLHKRRMFICRDKNCELENGFFSYEDYAQHTYEHQEARGEA